MGSPYCVSAETLRSVAFGSITNTFAALGAALAQPARLMKFVNTTDTDMLLSDDGTNSKIVVPAGNTSVYDWGANRRNADLQWMYAKGTQFYVKYNSAPSRGAMYIETFYGDAGS